MARVLFLLTGLSALVCEVCWIRKASLTLGSSTWALSVVLGVFFAGLALGSWLVGRKSTATSNPLRGYAWLELGVGGLAMLSPWLFSIIDLLYGQVYEYVFLNPWLLALTRLVMISLVLLPATTLMGGSLPLFCQLLERRASSKVARTVGQLYAINTLGAAIGAVLAGFTLIPTIGVNLSLVSAGVINVLVSFIAFRLAGRYDRVTENSSPGTTTNLDEPAGQAADDQRAQLPQEIRPLTARQRTSLAGIFFGVGLVAVAAEVLWARYLSLWMPNTVYTYSLTLGVVLLGIVIGSSAAALIGDYVRRRAALLGLAQVFSALTIMLTMQWRPEWWGQWLSAIEVTRQLAIISIVMLVPAILSGACFPLAISLMVKEARETGWETGRMTAINLFGGIVGSLLTGFILLPMLGLATTLWIITGLGLCVGLASWWLVETRMQTFAKVVLSGLAIATWIGIPGYCRTRLPQDFLGLDGRLIDFREGVNANVSVVKQGNVLRLEINRMWQGQNIKNHQIFAAHIPSILHADPKQVLVIGLGTGQTASSFLTHDIERLDCLEIEDGLVQLVRKHFQGKWLDDHRVQLIVEDGRNFVTHTQRAYDIISIEVGQIYRPRIASFYTAEFYRQLKPRLNEHGLICQFMPIEFFGAEEFKTLVATFREVFPECMLWYNTSELLLIGTNDTKLAFRPERLQTVLSQNERLRTDMQYAYWGGPDYYLDKTESFLAGYLCGPAQLERLSDGGQIYRDDRPFLEYLAVKTQSDAPAIIGLLQRQLTPLSLLIGNDNAELLSQAQRIRQENLQEINARVALAQAQMSQENGDLQAAFNAYQAALTALPKYPPANYALATFLQSQGDLTAAIEFYGRVLAVKPSDTRCRLRLAEALTTTGQFDSAEQLLRQTLQQTPDSIEAHTQLGWLLGQTGKHKEALISFETALKLDEKSTRALLGVANVLQSAGDSQEAQKVYAEVLQLDPEMLEARIGLAISLQQSRKYAEALENYQTVLKTSPNNVVALNAAAWLLATSPIDSMRDPKLSIELADRAWQLTQGQSPEAGDALAAAHAEQKLFKRAVEIIDLAIATARKQNLSEFASQLEARRELYSQSQVYHLPR